MIFIYNFFALNTSLIVLTPVEIIVKAFSLQHVQLKDRL